MALNSAMRVCARVQIPVCPERPPVFSHELLGGLRAGFLVVTLYELHVYSSTWSEAVTIDKGADRKQKELYGWKASEAEALSEYGVVTE
jgi:hypothetical protein